MCVSVCVCVCVCVCMQNIFGKMGNPGGIIQRDNSDEHCFVLRDLIPMNFFRLVMIMKLEMCTTGKVFAIICLKAICLKTFFQYVICNQGRNWVRHEECVWSDRSNNFEKSEREYFPSKQQIYSI